MSSSRSVAAARARRAGESAPPPIPGSGRPNTSISSQQAFVQQQQQQQQQNGVMPPPVTGKLAIGDAFALVTIRLGRLETIVQKLEEQVVTVGNNSNEMDGEGVNDTIVRSIINRLQDLEKEQKQYVKTPLATPTMDLSIFRQEITKMQTESSAKLVEHMHNLQVEINSVKDMLIRLQSFTMETNQKLVDVVFSGQENDIIEHINLEETSDEVNESVTTNLKNIIRSELANIENESEDA